MTRPFDKHLDSDELDGLVSSHAASVTDSGQLSEQALEEARHHVESCQNCSRKVQMHKSVQSEISRMGVPSNVRLGPDCITDVEWLNVVAGLLPEVKTRELMKHAAQCGNCGPLLRNATEILSDEVSSNEEQILASLSSTRPEWQQNLAATLRGGVRQKQKTPWWRQLFAWPSPAYPFAGIAVVILVAWVGVRTWRRPSAEQLLAQAYTEHRTMEVRIPGAKYAPMRVERGAGASNLDKPPSLLKAEALIGEHLSRHPNDPAWLQARARADLLDGNYESAIRSLQRALETQPDSASLLTDLGSAYFLRAESTDRPIDYGNAVESLGKALSKSPDDPVALFNRALACERLFLYTQAVDDWQHYLRIDPQGEWSEVARQRLDALQEKIKQHEKSQAEPLLTPAEIATEGADEAVQAIIDERIEDYLNLAITDWLPRAYPTTSQQAGDSESNLRTALAIVSEIATQKHSDRWLSDLLTTASSPSFASAVAQLADAVKTNDAGDNEAARRYASEAEGLFISAGSDAGALRARVEYIFASQDAQDGKECVRATQGMSSRLGARDYGWLRAQFLIEQGNCVRFLGDLGRARQAFGQASQEAAASVYGAIYLRSQDHLSLLNGTIGDLPSAWKRNHAALARFWSGPYPAMRGYNLYFGCYEFARAQQQPHLQFAAWRDGLALSETLPDKVIRAMAHSLMADAAIGIEQPQTAENEFRRASKLFTASPQIKSTRIAGMEAETRLAEARTREGKPQQATLRLRQLEPEISKLQDDFLAILFYTALGNAESEIGDGKQAESALRSAIGFAETQLQSVRDDASRLKWSQQTASTYRDFVQLRLRQGDPQGALEIWEWYRGAAQRSLNTTRPAGLTSILEPHQVAVRLPGLTTQTFISYALLPQGMATWVYDNRGFSVHWTERKPGDIEAAVRRFRILCSDPASDQSDLKQKARSLYDLLVAPIARYLAADRILVIELDDGLGGLPYEALLDPEDHYFGDRSPIVSSLGIYYGPNSDSSDSITADSDILVAAAPVSSAAEPSAPALPDAASEGQMVAHIFSAAHLFAGNQASVAAILSQLPNVSVFHFAGHAVSSPERSGLLLADGLFNSVALKPNSLARMQLAVFSACDTQDGSTGGVYDADSIARSFLRAGVPHVVASRWNVDSAATRQFMSLFYQALLKGNSVASSIRMAQIGLRSSPGMARPYYWSAFTAFGLT